MVFSKLKSKISFVKNIFLFTLLILIVTFVLDESVSADIRLETETEDGISEDVPPMLPENIYHPKRALKNAILDWLGEFKRYKQAWGPIIKPQPVVTMAIPVPIIPSINTCMSLTTTTQSTTTVTTVGFNNLQALAEVCTKHNFHVFILMIYLFRIFDKFYSVWL